MDAAGTWHRRDVGPPVKRGQALPSWRRLLIESIRARRRQAEAAAAPAQPARVLPVFREYERLPGQRGRPGHPEYRVDDIWSGVVVDSGFTFERALAERMFTGAIDQAYDAELWVNEGGDWQLIKRAGAPY